MFLSEIGVGFATSSLGPELRGDYLTYGRPGQTAAALAGRTAARVRPAAAWVRRTHDHNNVHEEFAKS